jgi:thioesterase domain-containing protein
VTAQRLLTRLRSLDIAVSVDGERLRVNAPTGALTPELQDELSTHKPEIIRLLRGAAYPPLTRADRTGPLPLSAAQERLWSVSQLDPHSPLHNMYLAFRLRGPLDVPALEGSLADLIQRHEILRTRYVVIDGEPVQELPAFTGYTLRIVDHHTASGDPSGTPRGGWGTDKIEHYIADVVTRPFDLPAGLPVRAELLRLDDSDHALILAMHHISADGWSWDVFLRELGIAYAARKQGASPDFATLPIQYADFAVWQRAFMEHPFLRAQLDYWRGQLEGFSVPVPFPPEGRRTPTPRDQGQRAERALPAELHAYVRTFAGSSDFTPFMTLLGAFYALLAVYTGHEDLLVCTPVAGRTLIELQTLIGYFNNLVPLRVHAASRTTFRELLARVRRVVLAGYEHQDVPFQRLAELPHLAQVPLARLVFALQGEAGRSLELDGLEVEALPVYNRTAGFDLFLTVLERGTTFALVAEYRQARVDAQLIDQMLADYEAMLRAGLQHPDLPLADLLPGRSGMRAPVAATRPGPVPPRTPLQDHLVHIWEQMLNTRPIGVKDDFFELGGHSLLALRLFTRIQKELGVNLPLALLLKDPTIEHLASVIEQGESAVSWVPLVPIRTQGSRPPLFAVHGLYGNVLFWRSIAMHLDVEQPFYGLQAPGLDGLTPALTRMEDLAARYIREIKAVQPSGPYYLCGYSLGGEIALAMAQQLVRAGDAVDLVIMLDTADPVRPVRSVLNGSGTPEAAHAALPTPVAAGGLDVVRRKIMGHIARLRGLPPEQRWRYLAGDLAMRFERISITLRVAYYRQRRRRLPEALLLSYIRESSLTAVLNHVPQVYPGKVVMFRSRESLSHSPPDSPMSWAPLVGGGFHLHLYDGTHDDLHSPRLAPDIARHLVEWMDEARRA